MIIHEISVIGRQMLLYQERLAREYRYQPIEPNLFLGDVREKYRSSLPSWVVNGHASGLESARGTLFAKRYNRIVVGDYGAFLEILDEDIIRANVMVQPGQEYRMGEAYQNVKYHWYTTRDDSGCKLYFQQNTVTYAEYVPCRWYISPYECWPKES